jgi:hypothetical protein
VANLSIINKARQFGTSNNYHAFLSDLTAGTPPTMLGRPVYEASAMDSDHRRRRQLRPRVRKLRPAQDRGPGRHVGGAHSSVKLTSATLTS